MVREGWCSWGGKVFVRVRIFLSPLLFQNKFICQTVNCQAVYEESFLPFQKWDLKRWPQWEKKSYHYALLVLMDWKEIQVYESFLYVIEAVLVLPWNTLPIEFQSNYSQGRQNSLLLFYIFFLRVHTTNTNLSSSLPSPNAICYKIGEKICDQFNNGFMLMVSGCYSCPTDFIFCVTLVLMINI